MSEMQGTRGYFCAGLATEAEDVSASQEPIVPRTPPSSSTSLFCTGSFTPLLNLR